MLSSSERAHVLARFGTARLAHLDDLAPERAQVLGEQSRLRRLAGAVGTLERDEAHVAHAARLAMCDSATAG